MDFRLPELGEGVYEAELVAWLVKVGDQVRRGQNLMEVLTDKASMEVPSPFAGTITSVQAEPGQTIKVGDVVLAYDGTVAAEPPAKQSRGTRRETIVQSDGKKVSNDRPRTVMAVASPGRETAGANKAAPSVRFMARKLGLDLNEIRGSGPSGRVLIDDLSAHVNQTKAESKATPVEAHPEYGTAGTRIKLHGLRRKIAEHMVLAKKTIPHYSYIDECEVTDLVRMRESLKESFSQAGIKLTYLPFFVKAVVAALKEIPLVNSSLDEAAGEIVLHERYNIGIAVSTPGGLIVPVIHDADQKDLTQIAREIDRLSLEAKTGKAKLEDLRGGTFTLSSVGNIGGLFSTPVINHPEVGILGIGKLVKRPVFDKTDAVRAADMVYLSFSFDHRVLDGAVGAAFSTAIIRQLQTPGRLLMPELMATG
jgi:2-oxoisovalerate dehydrogenase E2 component (dihydrolipoyl transacylase)